MPFGLEDVTYLSVKAFGYINNLEKKSETDVGQYFSQNKYRNAGDPWGNVSQQTSNHSLQEDF